MSKPPGPLSPLLYSSLSIFTHSCPPDFPSSDRQIGVTARLSESTPIPLFDSSPSIEIETQLPSFINHTRGEYCSFDDADGLIRSKTLDLASYCREVAAELVEHAKRLERRAVDPMIIDERLVEELRNRTESATSRATSRPVSIAPPSFSKGSAHRVVDSKTGSEKASNRTASPQSSIPSPADLDYLDDL